MSLIMKTLCIEDLIIPSERAARRDDGLGGEPAQHLPPDRLRVGRAGRHARRVRHGDRERRDEAGRHDAKDGQSASHVQW